MKRVVVTGFGAISPLGHDWPSVLAALKSGRNAVAASCTTGRSTTA